MADTGSQKRRADDSTVVVPTPDPTSLTTAALDREISHLREFFISSLDKLDEKLNTSIVHRGELLDVRFASVEQRFDIAEKARVEQKADTKGEVAAALTAQKEAVKEQTIASEKSISKSEAATAEAIRQLSERFGAAIESVSRSVNDVKDRVITIESLKTGAKDNTSALYAGLAAVFGFIAIIISVIHILGE